MDEKLGEVLRRNRKERNLTLRSVQERTGLSNAYLSQIETGKIERPSPNVLFKLSKLYDTSYEKLLSLAGHPLPKESVPTISNRFQQNLKDLSDEDKESVLEYIQFLKSRRR